MSCSFNSSLVFRRIQKATHNKTKFKIQKENPDFTSTHQKIAMVRNRSKCQATKDDSEKKKQEMNQWEKKKKNVNCKQFYLMQTPNNGESEKTRPASYFLRGMQEQDIV